MALSTVASLDRTVWLPVTATGTKTLPSVLPAGDWKIITDNSQSLTTVQLLLESSTSATQFGIAVRGGLGSVTTTEPCNEVTFTAGTFPLLIGFQRF